ncbi:PAS domain-containing protein [Dyadobacter aurulentus]|uniref:PAS domain-containing protein n=1 Tax=Dyadobacter sp. UC 10 TaxID=2605428 RepID=UPI0011F26931|nr:PAS domain-containing protein [Dyadobacter sp. UC 10]KAA0993290.1 PAS domain-containing protein [Dyadobacter sp. UC 10]
MVNIDFDLVFDLLPAPCIVLEADAPVFTVLAVNRKWQELTGTRADDVIGKGFFESMPSLRGGSRQEWDRLFTEVLHAGKQLQMQTDLYLNDLNGADEQDIRILSGNVAPLSSGNKQLLVVSVTDVTEIRRATQSKDLIRTIDGIVWEADADTFRGTFVSDQVEKILGYTAAEWLADPDFWANHMHSDDRAEIPALIPVLTEPGANHRFDYRMIRADGEVIWIRDLVTIVAQEQGPLLLRGFMVDITETKRLEDVERLEKAVIGLNAEKDLILADVLNRYLLGIEQIFPDMKCSILGIKDNRLVNWASPSLPETYIRRIENLEIGAYSGSCGTAAFTRKLVIVDDIATDRRWLLYKNIALEAGLLACWSHPIIVSDDTVIATFAAYYEKVRSPNEEELKLIDKVVALLTVILESRRNAEFVADAALLISQGQELARFGTWQWDIGNDEVTWSDTLYTIYGLERDTFKPSLEAYLELVHPTDRTKVKEGILNAMESKSEIEFEERIFHSSGESRYLKTWSKTKLDENGKVIKMIGACLDITASKKIQEELLASESRLRSLVDSQTNYVVRTDLVGKYTYYNSMFREDFRWFYNGGDFIGVNCILVVCHYHRMNVIEVVGKCLRNPGKIFSVELDHVQQSEKARTVYWHFIALTDSDGQATEIQCIGIDVSERKQAIDDLRKSNERYELLNMATNDAVYDWDLINDHIEWGEGFLRLFGLQTGIDKFPIQKWVELLHPTDRDPIEQSLQLHLADKNQKKWTADYRFRRSDGGYAFVEEIGYIRRNRSGRAVRMIGVLRDISRQKKEEYELKLLGSVITNTSDAILIAKSDPGDATQLRILYVNAAFTRLTGYTSAEVTGQNPMSLRGFDSPQNDFGRLAWAIRNVAPLKEETIRYQQDDKHYFINLSIHPVVDGAGMLTHWISIGRDVTEKRRYVSEIEERNQKLQDIAWMQSHVIRAPLARLMSLIDLLRNYENSETEKDELLEHILHSAYSLDDIIRDISSKTEDLA